MIGVIDDLPTSYELTSRIDVLRKLDEKRVCPFVANTIVQRAFEYKIKVVIMMLSCFRMLAYLSGR